MRGFLGRFWKRDSGVSAIEFALVAPLFFLMLISIVEFGRLVMIRNSLQFAAEQAARYVMTHESATNGEIATEARKYVSAVPPNLVTVNVTQQPAGIRTFVVIDVSFNFSFAADMLGAGTIPLAGRSRVAI